MHLVAAVLLSALPYLPINPWVAGALAAIATVITITMSSQTSK